MEKQEREICVVETQNGGYRCRSLARPMVATMNFSESDDVCFVEMSHFRGESFWRYFNLYWDIIILSILTINCDSILAIFRFMFTENTCGMNIATGAGASSS